MTAAVRHALAVRAELHAAAADPSLSFDTLDEIYNRFATTILGLSERDSRAYYTEDKRLRASIEYIDWPEDEPYFPGWTTSEEGGQTSPSAEEELIEWP